MYEQKMELRLIKLEETQRKLLSRIQELRSQLEFDCMKEAAVVVVVKTMDDAVESLQLAYTSTTFANWMHPTNRNQIFLTDNNPDVKKLIDNQLNWLDSRSQEEH